MIMKDNNLRFFGLFLVTAIVFSFTNSVAFAQSIDGKFKLGLETRLFRFGYVTPDSSSSYYEIGDITEVEWGMFSSGGTLSSSMGAFVLPASSLGTDLAGGLSDDVILGSRLMVDFAKAKGSKLFTELAFVPHIDYVFSRGQTFRPFIEAQLGVQASFYSELTSVMFMVGPALGAFIFVADKVSIDPRLSLLYSLSNLNENGGDILFHSITIAIMLGFSGWI
jgi:hypothetical protein